MRASQNNLFLWEALDLIGCTTILGVSYGIAFTLYCLCAQSLYLQPREPDQRRQARFTLGYSSLLLFFATGTLVSNGRMTQLGYVNHRADFPGGPLAFEANKQSPTTISLMLAGSILELVTDMLTMAVQVRLSRLQFDQYH